MFIVKSARIYTERGLLNGGLLIDGSTIRKLLSSEQLTAYQSLEMIDYHHQIIIPGIIEMHVHGYKGWYAMSPKEEDLHKLSLALATSGVTAFTPTNHLRTDIFANHQAIASCMRQKRQGARILGIHMEGPFISKERLGSVVLSEICDPDLKLMQKFYDTAEGHITTVTLAPELPGNAEIIDFCNEHAINVCLGHTNANYQEAKKAIDMGAIISQKTGNCMRPMHQRDLGVVGAVLLDHRIYNEINSDLRHTSADFLELCYRLKGKDKLCIIADGGVMSGMPVGEYNLPERGKYTVGADYLLRDSRGIFDGSTKHILFGMQNWVSVIGIPMEEAVVMAALNPAKVLKIDHQKGSIKEHKDADFTVINENFDVLATYVEGNKVYDRYDGVQYENQEYLNYRCQ